MNLLLKRSISIPVKPISRFCVSSMTPLPLKHGLRHRRCIPWKLPLTICLIKGRMDYGHQAIGAMLACGELVLDYAILLYDKSQSKIDMVSSIANTLPAPPNIGYLLCDSLYTCDKVMDAFIRKGFYTIAGLKTNRILYPCGIRTPLSEFASKLRKTDSGVHLVSVGNRKYWVYRYDGQINGTDGAAVILTYPENVFGKPKALRAFLCTNADLAVGYILNLYTKRWPVEVFF